MWIAKFKLRDDKDIYHPLCVKYKVDFFAVPHTNYVKENKINLLVSGIISGSGENKKNFIEELRKSKQIRSVEIYNDYVFVHAQHPISRESEAEIRIFYNPQYVFVKPVKVSSDGWEYWEVACIDRKELNKLVTASVKNYHGELFSIKKEKLRNVANLEFIPHLSEKQIESLNVAHKLGYYNYPRKLTIPEMAKSLRKSYSAFQENLRKAENKIIDYFFKYR